MSRKGMGRISGYKDLNVWKKSMQLVMDLYSMTSHFPKEDLYGWTSQILRSAVSIPRNIAEGAARQTEKEFCHFLYVAMGSLAELETQLLIAQNLGYISSFEPDFFNEISHE